MDGLWPRILRLSRKRPSISRVSRGNCRATVWVVPSEDKSVWISRSADITDSASEATSVNGMGAGAFSAFSEGTVSADKASAVSVNRAATKRRSHRLADNGRVFAAARWRY